MTSLILATAARFLTPLLLLFSVFLLFRGHNEPGGGFTGGLVAAAAFALHAVATGPAFARHLLALDPRDLIPVGLLLSAGSGTISWFRGQPFMTGQWFDLHVLGTTFHVGTPLFFDIGVYLVVLGVTLAIILTLAEEAEETDVPVAAAGDPTGESGERG